MKIEKGVSLLLFFLIQGTCFTEIFSQENNAVESFLSTYQNWAPLGSTVLTQNNDGGLGIKYSKRIDDSIMEPLVFEDPSALMPHISEAGIDWQVNLDPEQIPEFGQQALNQLLDLFGPGSADILSCVALQFALSQIDSSYGAEMKFFMQMIQQADQLTVSYYNHRFEVAQSWFKSGQRGSQAAANPFSDTTEFFRSAEANMMGNALSNRKAFASQDPPEVKLVNYLERIVELDPNTTAAEKNTIGIVCDSLNKTYNLVISQGTDGSSFVSGEQHIFNIIYGLREQFENFALYFIYGNSGGNTMKQVIDSRDAGNFIKNPNMQTLVEKSGIYQLLVNARNSFSSGQKESYLGSAEKYFMNTVLKSVDDSIYKLGLLEAYQSKYPLEIVDAKNQLIGEMKETSVYYRSQYPGD